MSNIHATLFSFEKVCKKMGVKQHPYIAKMLKREEKESLIQKAKGEFKTSMHLYLAGNNHLLTDMRMTDADCHVLRKVLQKNIFITSLDLRYNEIGDVGAQALAAMLEKNTSLRELNLMCNEIGPEGGEALARALHTNEALKLLRLNGNKMGNKGGMCFAQALQINATLEHLDLGDTDLRMESTIALATVLRHNTCIRVLNVSRPLLGPAEEEPVVHFALMLKVNTTLEEIHLEKYDMRDFGMHRLAENLIKNFTLTHLDLSSNRITRDGIKELAKVLNQNTALRVLDLGCNRLENDGAIHIANALADLNTTLKCLVVVSNNIDSLGLCAIADALKTNTTLTNIYIWGNKLEEPACIAFDNLIKTGRLDMRNTDVQPYIVDGVTYLSELNHGIRRHYYYGPVYGADVPDWQVRSPNPRSAKTDDELGLSLFD